MLRRLKNIDLVVKTCMEVKPNQQILIVAEDNDRPLQIAQQLAEACTAEGAEVVMAIMVPRTFNGQEPPKAIAEAMQVVDAVVVASERFYIEHTNAGKAVREKGIMYVNCQPERHFIKEISAADVKKIKARTIKLADILSKATKARVTTPDGTKLSMSLKGRPGIPLYPMKGAPIMVVPEYAEAAIAPVEGSTEGILVSDCGLRGWSLQPKEPLCLTIKKGWVAGVTGDKEYVARFKKLIATDENAANCAAELGFGTSHTMDRRLVMSGSLDGTIHIAVGRNNDIGGDIYSQIHFDLIMSKPTVWLDDQCVVKDGVLKI
ncbi:MAG: hypothetical protein V1767_00240 [Chloroflexota bacterium]